MGGSYWDDDDYKGRVSTRLNAGKATFDHDSDVRTGKASTVHETLNPAKMKEGRRESRDSANHPNSNPIIVGLDVTGSMSSVVKTIHSKLPSLMGLLTRKNYIEDPQILFTAVGDATCDRFPLQVGQFESGAEMEDNVSKFILEGGGGGQMTESYELVAYVGARKTSTDAWEKRGKKGYCFIIGDEFPYRTVSRAQVNHIIGDTIEADIPTSVIFKELREKYTTFYILPEGASYGHDFKNISKKWEEFVGPEHILLLKDPSGVAELIATQIGLCEGTIDIDGVEKDLTESGASVALVQVVKGSVSKAYKGSAVTKVPSGVLTPSTGSGPNVKRL